MDAKSLIREALREDLGRQGDITTRFFVPPKTCLRGLIVARQKGVICGTKIAQQVFKTCAPSCRIRILVADGGKVRPGEAVMDVEGGRGILTAERTALNFLQHLSGVATLTAAYAEAVRGTRARILDTRKTLPGWRSLEKYAVVCGGGENHRMGLYDAAMVKDNHWADTAGFEKAIRLLRRLHPRLPLIIETDRLDQVQRALSLKANIILLDNMKRPLLKRAIAEIRRSSPRTLIEISGGVDLKAVRRLARLGPDRISVGRITHSAPILDLGLDIE